jgi:hypothetical protein
MIPLAGAAIMKILKMIRDRKVFDLVIAAIALLLVFYATGITVARDSSFGKASRLVRLGKVYADSGEEAKALEVWREAIEIDPGHIEARRCLTGSRAPLPDKK